MKQVLIIDASPMFREFLKEKLTHENILVETAQGHRDAFTKLISLIPDLVILDIEKSIDSMTDFLWKKSKDPNAVNIPVIISGPHIEREAVADLARFGVIKYFTKPIKFDVFFESIGRVLKASFSMDTTPCVLEIHLNKNIIFIEIAQGLNREKLSLLKYKLSEMMDVNKLYSPKIVVMMTDLSLCFIDGANLELLFDNITADSRIQKKDIKVLSLDSFTRDFIEGHTNYSGIEVVTNLSRVLNSLVDGGMTTSIHELISDRILSSTDKKEEGSVEMRFYSDKGIQDVDAAESEGAVLKIALVDDDSVVRKILNAAFLKMSAKCILFDKGSDFIASLNSNDYDLVILDIFMPGLSGFDILKTLHDKKSSLPVIIYSQAAKKEDVIQALSLGAKSYLIKPQKTEVIIKKAIEVIHDRL